MRLPYNDTTVLKRSFLIYTIWALFYTIGVAQDSTAPQPPAPEVPPAATPSANQPVTTQPPAATYVPAPTTSVTSPSTTTTSVPAEARPQAAAPRPVSPAVSSSADLGDNPFELVPNGKKQLRPQFAASRAMPSPAAASDKTEPVAPVETPAARPLVPTAEEGVATQADTASPPPPPIDAENPFELVANGFTAPAVITSVEKEGTKAAKKKARKEKKKKAKKRHIEAPAINVPSFIKLAVLLLLTLLFALLRTMYRADFEQVFKSFSSSNMTELLFRDKSSAAFNSAFIIMYTITVVSIGTFIYLTANYFRAVMLPNHWASIGVCILFAGLGIGLKHLVVSLVGRLFPINAEMQLYNFTITLFNIILGVALIPFLALLSFAPANLLPTFMYAAFSLAGLIYVASVVRILGLTSGTWMLHRFHFITYLCTVEIAPIVIILKMIGF